MARLLHDYLFLIPLVVLFLTELAKFVVEGFRSREWKITMFRPGGMPSTHSAFVTSLVIIVHHKMGAQSPEFAIAFVFACVTWYDAMSSRRAVGEQAVVLNRLQKWKHFTERLGHTGSEVVGGILFGSVVTWIGIMISNHVLGF